MNRIVFILFFIVFSIQLIYCKPIQYLIAPDGALYIYYDDIDILGEGASGRVISGLKIVGRNYEPVALKFLLQKHELEEKEKRREEREGNTKRRGKKKIVEKTLKNEAGFYKLLDNNSYVPDFHDFFKFNDGVEVLIIKLMAFSWSHVLGELEGKFSNETTMMLGYQLLRMIKSFHMLGFVHGDIKPANLGIGFYNQSNIYALDFDLAEFFEYRDGSRIEESTTQYTFGRGTAKYASYYAHSYKRLSPRDDIETMAYVLMRCCDGKLPWSDYQNKKHIRLKKKHIDNFKDDISDFSRKYLLPIIIHARSIDFYESPDYKLLKKIFTDGLRDHGLHNIKCNYDWVGKLEKKDSYIEKWLKETVIDKLEPRQNLQKATMKELGIDE